MTQTELQPRSILYLEAIRTIVERIIHFDECQPMLDHVVAAVQQELDFYIASIFRYNREQQVAILMAQQGQSNNPAPLGFIQPVSVGLLGRTLREGRTQLVNDVSRTAEYVSPEGYAQAGAELCVPIYASELLWGAFNVESAQTGTFSANDQLALEVIATQLGSALHNLELRRRQQAILNELADQTSRKDELLSEVLRLATPLLPLPGSALALPLVGQLDDRRMAQTATTLLAAIQRNRSRHVLIDVTGIVGIDRQGGQRLANLARSCRLLGAEIVLTGIRPDMAGALVEAGLHQEGYTTFTSFAAGLSHVQRSA